MRVGQDDDDSEKSMIFMIGQSLLSRGREDEKVHSLADFNGKAE